jgi:hypothetical protein
VRKVSWSARTTAEAMHRRAGGRRRVNSLRTFRAKLVRGQVLRLLCGWGFHHGVQAKIARHLRISEASVSRHMKIILPLFTECPHTGALIPRYWYEDD